MKTNPIYNVSYERSTKYNVNKLKYREIAKKVFLGETSAITPTARKVLRDIECMNDKGNIDREKLKKYLYP